MKSLSICMLMLTICVYMSGCSVGNQFDVKSEKKKATGVLNSVTSSFPDKTKLAEGRTRDETNQIAWSKIKEKNSGAISNELSKEGQKLLLYILTVSQGKDLPNGQASSILLFSQAAKIKDISWKENDKLFIFNIERYGFDHKLITLKKQKGTWKIIKVE